MPKSPAGKPKLYLGGCLCGSIRFEATGPAEKPHSCSCSMCRKHSGALTTVWVEFAKERVKWTGPGGEPSVWRSSNFSSRAFCPQCGSTLGAVDDKPTIGLMTGAFDKPNARELMPSSHSYRGGRPKWWHVEIRADQP